MHRYAFSIGRKENNEKVNRNGNVSKEVLNLRIPIKEVVIVLVLMVVPVVFFYTILTFGLRIQYTRFNPLTT